MTCKHSPAWLIGALLSGAAPVAHGQPWHLDRVVVVMRHGVRPPTKPQPLPGAMVNDAWPAWDVGWGELTGHGARAIGVLGDYDRARYRNLLGSGCPAVRVVADIDERTLRTASVYAAHLLPGCATAVEHGPAGQADPRFSPFEAPTALSEAEALAAAAAALPEGGTAALDRQFVDQWQTIDAVTGCAQPACSVTAKPTMLSAPGGRARLSGALGTGASFAQTLALEYAEGKPMADVGWGRITPAQITRLSALHAAEFAITARPPAIARAGAAALLGEVRTALTDANGPRVTVFVGHDSNLSWLGGALGVHWQVPQFARDDPPPGGALVFERWTNRAGRYRLRLRFRSQTLDEMRLLTPIGHAEAPVAGFTACATPAGCSLAELTAAL
jgi:4-phytase/acid phosphatase